MLCPHHPPGDPGGDRGAAGVFQSPAPDAGPTGDPPGQLRQKALFHLSVLPAQGESGVPFKDECGRAGQLHGAAENQKLRAVLREHLQAGDHQGPALAQHQVGVFHGGVRSRPHPGAENRLGGNPGI